MRALEFIKVEGTGNDFVFLDGRSHRGPLPSELVVRLCHRHFGVGADGVLVFLLDPDGTPRMRIYNSDGSVAEMCGNGIRCFARILRQEYGFLADPLIIQTDAGIRVCHVTSGDESWLVRVDMGGIFHEDSTPLSHRPVIEDRVSIQGSEVPFLPISVGNPHAILFGEEWFSRRETLGPILSVHPRFPKGTNVEFARLRSDGSIELVVCERGVGFTLACGTGAQATVAAATAVGLVSTDTPVAVDLPGGRLTITIAGDYGASTMEGPARIVFRGTYPLFHFFLED
jgi:diaminopimelate epimerase